MPAIDTENAVSIPSPTPDEIVVTTPHIPGWELHLPPGTIIRDEDGQIVTEISITPIPVDRPPFPLPFGAEFTMYFTVQPGGAYIDRLFGHEPYGARIIYPNKTNEQPGTRVNFWNYDAGEKGWHIYGSGTVTLDGKQVVPDREVVVYEFAGASITAFGSAPVPGDQDDDGDPVDLGTGLFVLRKTDLFLPDVMPIALTRTHRRGSVTQGLRPFGIGSAHPYELFLLFDSQFQGITLILPDGGRVHYPRISPGTGTVSGVFEHTTTPSLFFKSRIQDVKNTWELTLKDGSTYTFTSANIPLLQSIRDRYGNKISIARGRADHGKVTRVNSPNGRWLEFTLDLDDIRGSVIQVRDNIGRVITYGYDDNGRLTKVTDPMGGVTEYTYDIDRILTIKDARGIIFLTNEYDDRGRVIKQTLADGSTYEFEYTVDANGKITQTVVTDPRGSIRRVTFNADGYILTDTRALGTSEEQTTIYEREAGTNLVLRITDPLGRKTVHTHDTMGNMTTITRLADTPEAVTTEFTYEPKFNQPRIITSPLGHTTACVYDEKGNLTTLTDALSNSMTLAYNPGGQPVSVTDALGSVARLTYDFGIRSSRTNPLDAAATRYIDGAGRPITLTDGLGQPSTYEYDAHNHLTQVTDSLGKVTELSYDRNGNLLNVTDARGSVTNYIFDTMDRLESRKDPLGRSESYQYDAVGNITQFTDRKGQATIFSYDALNRLTQETYADGSTTTYTYDAGNRLTQVVDSVSGTITLAYDSLDRLTAKATPQGSVIYAYDAIGRRTSMTVEGQNPITYTYDDANHLTQITQGASAVTIAYDAAGRLVSLTLPGDVFAEYGYDAASQLTNITYLRAGTVLGELIYEYDAAGNRVRVGGSFARTTIPEAVSALAYDAANQLTHHETTSLNYDANGNLTSDGVRSYIWDARNQLASINGTGLTASFQYDAFGRRARKTVNGITTEFLYDGLTVVQEASDGTPIASLLTGLGIDEYFVRTTANGSQIVLFDALGSTVGLLDVNGVLQTEYAYEPFGATTATGIASTNPFQFTGRENDASGLYNYRARYYSPTLRRFISEDPLGFAGGDINLYAYALSSPTNFTDPLGLSVDAISAADCLDRIGQARERQKQMETSGRKDHEVEEVKEAIEEINRTNWDMIECLSPVPLLGMAFPRGHAIGKMEELVPRIEEHLAKLGSMPGSENVPHWHTELHAWIGKIERLIPSVGKKTGAGWIARVAGWRRQQGIYPPP
jgi:RHS repeat-associated protein